MRLSFHICTNLDTQVVSKQDLLVKGRWSSTGTPVGEEEEKKAPCSVRANQNKKKIIQKKMFWQGAKNKL